MLQYAEGTTQVENILNTDTKTQMRSVKKYVKQKSLHIFPILTLNKKSSSYPKVLCFQGLFKIRAFMFQPTYGCVKLYTLSSMSVWDDIQFVMFTAEIGT